MVEEIDDFMPRSSVPRSTILSDIDLSKEAKLNRLSELFPKPKSISIPKFMSKISLPKDGSLPYKALDKEDPILGPLKREPMLKVLGLNTFHMSLLSFPSPDKVLEGPNK